MSYEAPVTDSRNQTNTTVGQAVLTEAIKHVDIINTSLFGMTAMILLLTGALSLPVLGHDPVTQLPAIIVIAVTVFIGSGVLYYMNYQVHQHVASQAALTEVLVNSLGQGFLTFDQKGVCGNVYSQVCVDLMETIPAGKEIANVLHVPDDQLSDFKDWLGVLFMSDHAMSFEDVVGFFPQFSPHSMGKRVRLIYRPIREKSGVLSHVVVISTDETDQYKALEQAREKQNFAEMICRIFKDRNQFRATLIQLRDFLAEANSPRVTLEGAAPLLRQLHTLKAAVRHFCLTEMGNLVQHMEAELRSPSITTDEQFKKVLLAGRQQLSRELDSVLGSVRDVMGDDTSLRGVMREFDEDQLYAFAAEIKAAGADDTFLHRYIESIIAIPLHDCLRSFEREIIDLISIKNKQINPILYTGANPKVMARVFQDFLMSLSHVARNIVDHGIEAPTVRVARGKKPAGTVKINSEIKHDSRRGDVLVMSIEDDGNGIDPMRVREKLGISNPEGPWVDEPDDVIIQHIFDWGLSTSDTVNELSGRGVGMEAVAREVERMGGKVTVESAYEKGTKFTFIVPYKLDIENIQTKSLRNTGA